MPSIKLVIGASGFLGSHVTRQLVARGDTVRVLIRTTSSTRGIDGLPVEIHHGDIFDEPALRSAMQGCDVVYYCVVDARPWLRDSTPMWRTNVEGLRHVLDVAAGADLRRFVFTSSIATIGRTKSGPADETLPNDYLDIGGDYIRSRVAAAVRGKLPFSIKGYNGEVVGIEDAARAMLLAGEHGRIGERYIVSERFMSTQEIYEIACNAVGVAPPRRSVPIRLLAAVSHVGGWVARIRGRDTKLTPVNVRLMNIMSPMDHSKAVRELGWEPSPTPEAIAEAARFFRDRTRKPATAQEPPCR